MALGDLFQLLPYLFLLPLLLLLFLIPVAPILLFLHCRKNRQLGSFAFFHPYCDAGGGGERVLWRALNAMHRRHPNLTFIVYTGDMHRTGEQILQKAHSRFGITVQADRLQFVYLRTRWLLEAKNYPRFTLLAQMFAGLVLGAEAIWRHCPEWFIDTTGCPLVLPVFRWIGGVTTLAYVHYPTITTEMIQLVDSRTTTYNNSSTIAASPFLTRCKSLYYRLIALLYRGCGHCCQLTMVNGSWTAAHIAHLWGCAPTIVFPPCDIEKFAQLANGSEQKFEEEGGKGGDSTKNGPPPTVMILSVGQIRPEKNHLEQLRIFAEVRRLLVEQGFRINLKLVIVGGCRDRGDEKRVEFLQNYARGNFHMEPGREVDWELNVPFERLTELMQRSMIGLHTMWNEHFGISIVEQMAAGQIMIAHKSGGPMLDIIGESKGFEEEDALLMDSQNDDGNKEDTTTPCGFLATTREEYSATILHIILDMGRTERDQIRLAARQRAQRFSDCRFDEAFCNAVAPFLRQKMQE